jgi:hypothetical protein
MTLENTPKNEKIINYMGGVSFKSPSALQRLKLISSSFIRGESKQYYNGNGIVYDTVCPKEYLILNILGETSDNIFDKAVKEALDEDFDGTIKYAVKLRNELYMRKNPQIIMMEAAKHKKRPGNKLFRSCLSDVINIPTDISNQLLYWCMSNKSINKKFKNELKGNELMGVRKKEHVFVMNKKIEKYTKKGLPSAVKRTWARKLEKMSAYQIQKYKKHIPSIVRISHPNGKKNKHLQELLNKGKVTLKDNQKTWEVLRSNGMTWLNIVEQLQWKMPHMAALRNIRGFCKENQSSLINIIKYLEMVLSNVENGKQFPFRYYSAWKAVDNYDLNPNVKELICEYLDKCLHASMKNYPKLEGDTISLCDNSGSAHSTVATRYSSMKVSTIGNLSALFTAYNTTGKGTVGVFGDKLILYDVKKDENLLKQLDEIEKLSKNVGMGTENGIWIFFREALNGNENYIFDNIFIYSDMQAGHGGLYGIDTNEYKDYVFEKHSSGYVDVLKLVNHYRKHIKSKMNVFSIQIAGYDNSSIPDTIYRGSVMSGWTGNEVVYAKELIDVWNDIEK